MVLQEAGQVPRGPQVEYVRSKLKLLLYFTNMAAYLMFRAQGVSQPHTAPRHWEARALQVL